MNACKNQTLHGNVKERGRDADENTLTRDRTTEEDQGKILRKMLGPKRVGEKVGANIEGRAVTTISADCQSRQKLDLKVQDLLDI